MTKQTDANPLDVILGTTGDVARPSIQSIIKTFQEAVKGENNRSAKCRLLLALDDRDDYILNIIKSFPWDRGGSDINKRAYSAFTSTFNREAAKIGLKGKFKRMQKTGKRAAIYAFSFETVQATDDRPAQATTPIRRSAETAAKEISQTIRDQKESRYAIVLRLAKELTSKERANLITALQADATTKAASKKAKGKLAS